MSQEQLKLFYQVLETQNLWNSDEIRMVLLEIVVGIRTAV